MEVIFIRHLATPGNEKRQYIGRTDEPLSDRAVTAFREQQEGTEAAAYPDIRFLTASPMRRCVRTAELIWPGAPVEVDPLLRECDFGRFEGKTYEELREEPAYIRWLESGGMTAFPDGESQEAFRERCEQGVRKWIRRWIDAGADRAAFVIHGGTIMAALSRMAEGRHSFYDWQAGNGCGYSARAMEEEWKNGTEILRDIRKIG